MERVRYDPLTGALHHDRWFPYLHPDGSTTYFNAGWGEYLVWPPFEHVKIVFPEAPKKPEPRQGFLRRWLQGWLKKFYGKAVVPGSSVVERSLEEPRVGSSILPRGTKKQGLTMYPK